MRSDSALVRARGRWGVNASIRERRACPNNNGRWCEVGALDPVAGKFPHEWLMEVYGSGPSWVQAFKAADEYQPAARGETRPGHPVGGTSQPGRVTCL
jgi:hypothetical protein